MAFLRKSSTAFATALPMFHKMRQQLLISTTRFKNARWLSFAPTGPRWRELRDIGRRLDLTISFSLACKSRGRRPRSFNRSATALAPRRRVLVLRMSLPTLAPDPPDLYFDRTSHAREAIGGKTYGLLDALLGPGPT